MSTFSFDKRAFERAIQEAAQSGLDEMGQQMEALLKRVGQQHRKESVAKLKAALAAQWQAEFGKSLQDPHLSEWAQALHDGRNIDVRVDKIKF